MEETPEAEPEERDEFPPDEGSAFGGSQKEVRTAGESAFGLNPEGTGETL